jgi:hypothetical protein
LVALEHHNELMTLIHRLNGDVLSLLTARVNALQRELLLRLAAPSAASLPPAPSVGPVALSDSPSPSVASVGRHPVLSGQPVTPSDSAPGFAAQSVPSALREVAGARPSRAFLAPAQHDDVSGLSLGWSLPASVPAPAAAPASANEAEDTGDMVVQVRGRRAHRSGASARASGPAPTLAPAPAPGRAAREVVVKDDGRDAGDNDNDDGPRLRAVRGPRDSFPPPMAVRAVVRAAARAPATIHHRYPVRDNRAATSILPPCELAVAELQGAGKAAPSPRPHRAGAAAAAG